MPDELGRGIGAVFLKGFEIAETAELVKKGVLEVSAILSCLADKTGGRDEFHIDLDALAGILHLLIWLGNVFWVGQLHHHLAALTKKSIQAGNRSGIAPLPQLYPKHDQPGIWIPAPHIFYQPDLLFSVLVRMVVWSVGAILQTGQRAIVSFAPAVDVLPVSSVAHRCLCHSMLVRIFDKGLPKPGGLCYLVHSE